MRGLGDAIARGARFNPNHDPSNGEFTEAGAGGSGGYVKGSSSGDPTEPLAHMPQVVEKLKEIGGGKITGSAGFNYSNRTETQGDPALADIAHAQGFDGKPTVVSEEELQGLINDGWTEAYRGMRLPAGPSGVGGDGATTPDGHDTYSDQFRYGDYYAGTGLGGNGTYVALGDGATKTADLFGADVMHLAINPEANVLPGDQLFALKDEEQEALSAERLQIFDDARAGVLTNEQASAATSALETDSDPGNLMSDAGRWAAAHGYDAIVWKDNFGDPSMAVVLNRTAVAVAK